MKTEIEIYKQVAKELTAELLDLEAVNKALTEKLNQKETAQKAAISAIALEHGLSKTKKYNLIKIINV
jgi:hypothetical protein